MVPQYPNRTAFLAMLAYSEGTGTSPATANKGYDVVVTGLDGKPEVFTDYSDHPFMHRAPKVINSHGLVSTASGRYQILVHDWPYYKKMLGLPDFGPASQDQYALQLIRERCALPLIDGGHVALAIDACHSLWASLPGANYPGQAMRSLQYLISVYAAAGGLVTS